MRLQQFYKEPIETGILVVDNQMRMVSLNRKFIDMWQIPKELIALQNDRLTLEFVSTQFKYPDYFLKKVQYFYNHSDKCLYDLLILKNGRAFERFSCPQLASGKQVGRLWVFLECINSITSQKIKEPDERKVSSIKSNFNQNKLKDLQLQKVR